MLESIGLKNLRSFAKTTKIELKPITVFVGKNSSGKSSFLRTLPLFRQSIESNTTGPILWFGRYVDFGDFSEVVSNNAKDEPIHFNFDIKTNVLRNGGYRISEQADTSVNIDLGVVAQKQKTVTHSIKIVLNDVEIEIPPRSSFSSTTKVIIRYKDQLIIKDDFILTRLGQFIPNIMLARKREDATNIKKDFYMQQQYYHHYHDEVERLYLEEAVNVIKKYFNSRTDSHKIMGALARIPITSRDTFHHILSVVFRDQRIFSKHLIDSKDEILNEIYPYLIAWNFNALIRTINMDLHGSFSQVKYIAPLRATTERYYRFQDLQVNEIDHTGSNLAMLLNSLRPNEQKEFSSWTLENFGFSVVVKEVGAHYAVKITSLDDSTEYNISDMGFGYSQVLPIITTIWLETERRKRHDKYTLMFVIEQPELHLHPEYQAKLGVLFAKVVARAKEKDVDLKIIFETHSPNIIEALGEVIEYNETGLSKDDVSVIVFDKDSNKETNISKSFFDDNGFLMNWPVGFFSGK